MKRLLLNVMPALLLALSFTACRKDKTTGSGGETTVTPVKFPIGQPAGNAVTKTIGAAGGTLALADGSVSLSIPAGAVSANTEFSIQPLNNTLPAGKGPSYRLLPEGATFSKPVQLTFKYTTDFHKGSIPEAMFLSYQDHDAYWHVIKNTTINKTNRTLSVNTTHFSDWGIFCDFELSADKETLSASEVAHLKILTMESQVSGAESIHDWLLGDIKEYNVPSTIVGWQKNGPGELDDSKKTTATYKAPANITEDQTVQTEVTIKDVVNKKYPDRVGLDGKVILICPLNLTSASQFFRYTVGGQSVNCTGFLYGTNPIAQLMSFQGVQGDTAVSIVLNRIDKGVYRYREQKEPFSGGTEFVSKGKLFGNSYTQCDSPYKKIWSPGSVNITRLDPIGGYIEGSFNTTAYYFRDCKLETKSLSGEFRFKRNY